MAEEFTAKFKVDISDLKKNITEANKQIKLANATFKAETAGMEDWTKDADGLSKKLDQLKSVLSSQKSILSSYKEQLDRQQKAYDENSARVDQLKAKLKQLAESGISKADAEYQKYETALKNCLKEQQNNAKSVEDLRLKLLNQKAAVGKTEAQIEKYTKAEKDLADESKDAAKDIDKVDNALEDVGKQADKSDKKLGDLGKTLATGLATGVAAVTAAIGAGLTALAKFTTEAGNYADEINTLSKVTGMSTDDLQAYKYAAELVDVSLDTLTGSMAKNVKSMSNARNGQAKFADAYEKLGVSITNANGELRDSETVFWEAIDALGKFQNETERDATAMQLFGKSAQDLNPLIQEGSKRIAELKQEAQDMGAVMSQDTLDAFNQIDDSMQRLKGGSDAAKNALGTVLLPQLQELADSGVKLLGEFTNGILDANGDWEKISDTISKSVGSLSDMILDKLPMIVDTGATIIESLGASIISALPKLTKSATLILEKVTGKLLDGMPKLLDIGTDVVLNLADGLQKAIPNLLKKVSEVVPKIVSKLISAAPKLLEGALKLWKSLIDALPETVRKLAPEIPKLIKQVGEMLKKAIPQLTKAAIELFKSMISALWEVGKELVLQIPAVIGSAVSAIGDSFTGVFRAIETGLSGVDSVQARFEEISQRQSEIHEARMKENDEEIEALKNNREEWQKTLDERKKSVSGELGEIEYYESLAQELETLVDKSGKVKKGYEERADFIVGRLAEAFGEEYNNIGKIIDQNGKLTGSIKEAIDEKKKQILLSAKEETYAEAIKQQEELKKQSKATDELLKNAESRYNSAYNRAQFLYDRMAEERAKGNEDQAKQFEREAKIQEQRMAGADAEIDAYKERQSVIRESIADTVYAIQDYENAYNQSADEITNFTRKEREEFEKTGDAKKAELEEKIARQKTYIEDLKQLAEESGTDMYDAEIARAERQLKADEKALEDRKKATEKGYADISKAAEDETKKGQKAVNDEIKSGSEEAEKTMKQTAEDVVDQTSKTSEQMESVGSAFISGFAKGLKDITQNQEVMNAAAAVGNGVKSMLQGILETHSPSRFTERIGRFFVEGLADGIAKNAPTALSAVSQFGAKLTAAAQGMKAGLSVAADGIAPTATQGIITNNNQKSINFTQNNYSPKALSRIDIYRQTRNTLELIGENI